MCHLRCYSATHPPGASRHPQPKEETLETKERTATPAAERTPWWERELPTLKKAATSSVERALKESGLGFDVEMRPIAHFTADGSWEESKKYRAVVRDDTDTPLGVVGMRYHPINHRDALAFVTEICEEYDADIDRCWSLQGGARVRVCVQYKREVDIAGIDAVRPFLLFTAGHDGLESVAMQVIPMQLACTNQIPGLRKLGGKHTIVHSARAQDRLRTATEAIVAADRNMDVLALELEKMVSKKCPAPNAQRIVQQAIGETRGSDKAKEEDAASIIGLMKEPLTLPKGAEGTRFAVLHAVTEHYGHIRTYRTRAAQEREMTIGRSAAVCRRAMELLAV